jgi:hypothetical protein
MAAFGFLPLTQKKQNDRNSEEEMWLSQYEELKSLFEEIVNVVEQI